MTLTTSWQLVGSAWQGSAYGKNYYQGIYACYSRTAQQEADNKSTIVIKVCAWNDADSDVYSASGNWVGKLNGLFSGISAQYNSYAVVKGGVAEANRPILWSGLVEVTHANDGTYSTSIGATEVDSPVPNSVSTSIASVTLTLPTIPRTASLTAIGSLTIGDNDENKFNAYFSPYVSNFTYTLVGSNSNGTITFLNKQNVSSYSTTTLSQNNFYTFLNNNSTYADVTFTLTTYSGNTIIGTDSKVCRVYANSEHKPIVAISSVDTGKVITDTTKTTLDLTGSNKRIINKWNIISATWSASVDNRYNTYVASVSIYGNNVSTSPTTLNDISNSISITATDARGTSNSLTESDLTFIPYEYPSIVPTIKRNTATDGYVNLTFTGMFYNVDFGQEQNDLTLEWYVREKGTQNYTQGVTALTYTENANNTSYVNSATISLVNPLDQVDGLFDYSKIYEFKFVATDLITSYTISEVVLPKGIPNFVVFKNALLANQKRVDNKYSTNELKIGEWTNDKPIYRKVISTNLPSTLYPTTWQTFIQTVDVDEMIDIRGIIIRDNGQAFYTLPRYENSSYFLHFRHYQDYIWVLGQGYDSNSVKIIFEYTKTTD